MNISKELPDKANNRGTSEQTEELPCGIGEGELEDNELENVSGGIDSGGIRNSFPKVTFARKEDVTYVAYIGDIYRTYFRKFLFGEYSALASVSDRYPKEESPGVWVDEYLVIEFGGAKATRRIGRDKLEEP